MLLNALNSNHAELIQCLKYKTERKSVNEHLHAYQGNLENDHGKVSEKEKRKRRKERKIDKHQQKNQAKKDRRRADPSIKQKYNIYVHRISYVFCSLFITLHSRVPLKCLKNRRKKNEESRNKYSSICGTVGIEPLPRTNNVNAFSPCS